MSVEIEAFLDTNVLVHAVAIQHRAKHETAARLVRRGFEEGCFAVSTQVLLELYVTVTRKISAPLEDRDALRLVRALRTWRVVAADGQLVEDAAVLAQRFKISLWDAAILEGARRAPCPLVLSEDLAHGQDYAGVRVENPFRNAR
ncbi:MAG: PIN domain-containing protein [Acidobacteria bacterium]|nr:PIN domain-containing protein [Acidobacteriota bacterium]